MTQLVYRYLHGQQRRRWPAFSITGVHLRRYRLRGSAIELFVRRHCRRKRYFLNFRTTQRDVVARAIASVLPRHVYRQPPGYSPGLFFTRSGATQAWVDRRISNFEYLMKLNMFAGMYARGLALLSACMRCLVCRGVVPVVVASLRVWRQRHRARRAEYQRPDSVPCVPVGPR